MIKNKKILFIMLFFLGIVFIPKNVFALECDDKFNTLCGLSDESFENKVISNMAMPSDLKLLNFSNSGNEKKVLFTYSFKKDSGSAFNSKIYGLKLVKGLSFEGYFSNYFNFNDLVNNYPYYIYYKDYYDHETFIFSKSKDIFIDSDDIFTDPDYPNSEGGYQTDNFSVPILRLKVYIKDIDTLNNDSNTALAMAFRKIYTSETQNVSVYNSLTGGNSPLGNPFYEFDNKFVEINGTKHYQIESFNFHIDRLKYASLEDFINSSDFISNANIINVNGESYEYKNYVKLSSSDGINASDSIGLTTNFPTSLTGILGKIPELVKTLSTSFSLVGSLFGVFLESFPPVIVTGLYTVFILGIIILIIKTLS